MVEEYLFNFLNDFREVVKSACYGIYNFDLPLADFNNKELILGELEEITIDPVKQKSSTCGGGRFLTNS